ncbi:MAG: laminin, partial [Chthoniobacteraceae bacterium]|nr:laminin [Chthoniobacteraceae bacterium]
GTLQLGENKLAGALDSGNFSVAAGATLVFARNNDNAAFLTQSISGAGDVLFTGQSRGYFTWRTDYTGNLTYTGKTIVNYDADSGGTWFERGFWLEKDNLLPHGTVLDVQSAKVFLRNNTINGETIGGLEGSAGTFITTDRAEMQKLTFDVAAGQSYRYDGVIGIDNSSAPIEGINAGNIALFKNGPGKQILAGANTYSGATTVNGGTLAISGSISGASTVVGSGAVLASGLTGSVQTATGGNIAINHGGSLAPGDIGAAGVLTLNPGLGGKLSFESGSMLQFDIGTSSDLVTFFTPGDWLEGNGNTMLVLNGTINYTQIYTVFENVTTSGFTLAGITGYDASRYFANFVQSGMDYELSFTAVPEPAATGLLVSGFGLLLGLNRFRRGRRP